VDHGRPVAEPAVGSTRPRRSSCLLATTRQTADGNFRPTKVHLSQKGDIAGKTSKARARTQSFGGRLVEGNGVGTRAVQADGALLD
jgi:hypothetical protein